MRGVLGMSSHTIKALLSPSLRLSVLLLRELASKAENGTN